MSRLRPMSRLQLPSDPGEPLTAPLARVRRAHAAQVVGHVLAAIAAGALVAGAIHLVPRTTWLAWVGLVVTCWLLAGWLPADRLERDVREVDTTTSWHRLQHHHHHDAP